MSTMGAKAEIRNAEAIRRKSAPIIAIPKEETSFRNGHCLNLLRLHYNG
jgi:hypothetical protein